MWINALCSRICRKNVINLLWFPVFIYPDGSWLSLIALNINLFSISKNRKWPAVILNLCNYPDFVCQFVCWLYIECRNSNQSISIRLFAFICGTSISSPIVYICTGSVLIGSSPQPTSESFLLPHWCIYVNYAACVAAMALCIFFIIVYGSKFGPDTSTRWLLSMLIALLESFFIIEPVKVSISCCFAAESESLKL